MRANGMPLTRNRVKRRVISQKIHINTFKSAAALRSGLSKVQSPHPVSSVEAKR
jgi:hypothetical protein